MKPPKRPVDDSDPPSSYLTMDLMVNTPLEGVDILVCANAAVEQVAQTLTPVVSRGKPVTFTLQVSDDETVHELNKTYRGKDKPTNVLSFEMGEDVSDAFLPEKHVGDIVIAQGVLTREAHAAEIPTAHHFQHLVVHGLLHLFGYDHQTDDEAEVMEAIEVNVLAQLHISNPYMLMKKDA